MINLEDKVTIDKTEYSVSYNVKGEELEDLIDLTITDIHLSGKSVYDQIRRENGLDKIYSKLIDSKIGGW